MSVRDPKFAGTPEYRFIIPSPFIKVYLHLRITGVVAFVKLYFNPLIYKGSFGFNLGISYLKQKNL